MTLTTDAGHGVRLRHDGPHVVVLTLNGPQAGALSARTHRALRRALDQVEADEQVRAVVLTGGTGHFCSGGHLGEEQSLDRDGAEGFISDLLDTTDRVEGLRVPVIAAVSGGAVGGGLELALACDIRIAAEDAFFVAAGVNVGLIMSTWRLPRLIGLGPAKDLLLTGSRCLAGTALRVGLVSDVVAGADLMTTALARAHRIASRSPLSVEATKAAANRAHDLDADTGRTVQVESFGELFRTRDHQEAVRAFFERRDPSFRRS